MGSLRVLVIAGVAACGRIGFDPQSIGDSGVAGDSAFACTGAPAVTEPPTSGGGFVLVRAWGAAPNAPAGSPATDSVELAWQPRIGGARYIVVRTACGAVDITAAQPCTSSTTTSCVACSTLGLHCMDSAALPAPARVRYQVTVAGTPLPDDATFTVDVPTPPPAMVLLHRASVNREMCDLLASPTDPAEHHRCAYTGPGAVPLRAHPDSPDLGLPVGFFDFGYDLFVDRWETACNWTHAADGGMCGPGNTPGDCAGVAGPSDGVDGNVYWLAYSARCLVHTGGAWIEVKDLAPTDHASLAASYANEPGPGHDRPPQAWIDLLEASAVCSAISVPGYGSKRLWRLREFVAAGAFERMPGDPAPLDAATIATIEGGLNHPVNHGCNTQIHDGVTVTGFRSGDELARDISISTDPLEQTESFLIGSVATSRCVSRYGVQDMIGNAWEVTSDQMTTCGPGIPCVGIASEIDAGNTDLEGFALDGNTGAGPNLDQVVLESFPKVLLPLAMPLAATAPYGSAPDASQLRGDTLAIYSAGLTQPRMCIAGGDFDRGSVDGRFATDFGATPTGSGIDATWGMRCVVAAVPR